MNRITLIGHLGKDPEIRQTTGGNAVASFSVATSERWTDKASGEKKDRTEWHNVVVWSEGLVPVIEKYLKKGSHVLVEGKSCTRKWTDKEGADRYTTEVVLQGFDAKLLMLDKQPSNRPPPADDPDSYGSHRGSSETAKPARSSEGSFDRELDDEIPF